VLNKPINSETETNVREVVLSAAGGSAHNCQTPQKTGLWEMTEVCQPTVLSLRLLRRKYIVSF
jgi:hypothetical protein